MKASVSCKMFIDKQLEARETNSLLCVLLKLPFFPFLDESTFIAYSGSQAL